MLPATSSLPAPAAAERALSRFFFGCVVLATAYRLAVLARLGLNPYVDEAYYWGWAQALDWGYYSKPPLIAALLALSERLFGDNLYALKAPSLMLYPATALVIHRLGCVLFDARTGCWAGLAFLTLPATSALGLFASTDAPLLLCWALALLLLWQAQRDERIAPWLGLGVVTGLGLMSKYTMLAFAGSALLALLAEPAGRRRLASPGPWLALAVALAIFAPNLWWNAHHGFPTFQHTAEITRLNARGWEPDELGEFLLAQWAAFGPLLALGLLLPLRAPRALWADARLRFLLVFVWPLLLVVSLQALTGRANGNWAAPVFVAGCLFVAATLQPQRARLLMAAVALNIVLGLGLYHWQDLLAAAGKPLTGRSDPYKRARGWDALVAAVRPHYEAARTRDPDVILMGDDRELLAQLIYGLRPLRYARWQADAHIVDHYGLTAPLRADDRGSVLFASIRRDPAALAEVTRRFEQAQPLGEVDVALYPDFHRRASLWLLKGFKAY
ncbi:ArnT family glycosyltransferase [Azoarcus olearius]|uniref:ArnT family glycosyltransferase n=1 Tax=Azoarcus sp. (strain BH72) TaxID=418699 RepID=UPI000806E70A|nr:glycosyltransferase family 39 protein [Azoarcus olearius]